MQKEKGLKSVYNRICDLLSIKHISWMAIVLFAITLIPIIYLSFVNRASGDDYGYGTYTRAAWLASNSLWEVIKAACYTIKQYYYSWQGTWFSIFVFSLQPEVFSENAYVIVVFLMLFLWIGSTFLLFREVLVRGMKLDKWSYLLITTAFMVLNIQFIPSTKSAIFWFNGCAHYLLPFAMCQLLVFLFIRYCRNYGAGVFIGIVILMTLLGGSNYQAALFALIAAFYAVIADYFVKKNKKVFYLFLPIITEIIGLVISMAAPGNKVRGGEEFGLSAGKAVSTVLLCFVNGFKLIVEYLQTKPIIFLGLFVLFLLMLEMVGKREKEISIKAPIVIALALFCLYCAMQAPEIYAGVEVSGGVYNMNYQTFLLMMAGLLYLLAEEMSKLMRKRKERIYENPEKLHRYVVIPGVCICTLLLFLVRSDVKESTMWKCMEYISSGQAADYKEQMNLQTELLLDEEAADVIVPFINDEQGPLMQMPVTDNPEAWTNKVTRQFYGKNSVIAMDRIEWEIKYGNE